MKRPHDISFLADLFSWVGFLSVLLSAVANAVAETITKKGGAS